MSYIYRNIAGEKVNKARALELLGIFKNDLESQQWAMLADAKRHPSASEIAILLCPASGKYGELVILRRGCVFHYYYQPQK